MGLTGADGSDELYADGYTCRNRMDPRMEWTSFQVLRICAYIG